MTTTKQKAIDSYRFNMAQINRLMRDIGRQLIANDNVTPEKDWGHVADLCHILELLKRLNLLQPKYERADDYSE